MIFPRGTVQYGTLCNNIYHHPTRIFHIYAITLSTHFVSSRLISFLKSSTSCSHFSGRVGWSRKQVTKKCRDRSTAGSNSRTAGRFASRSLNAVISDDKEPLLREWYGVVPRTVPAAFSGDADGTPAAAELSSSLKLPGPATGIRGDSSESCGGDGDDDDNDDDDDTGFDDGDVADSAPDEDGAAAELASSFFSISARVCASRDRMRSSSWLTRCWICSSKLCAREESVLGDETSTSQLCSRHSRWEKRMVTHLGTPL